MALNELKLRGKQRLVVEILCAANRPMVVEELSEAAQCGVSPIHALRDKGLITAVRERRLTAPDINTAMFKT